MRILEVSFGIALLFAMVVAFGNPADRAATHGAQPRDAVQTIKTISTFSPDHLRDRTAEELAAAEWKIKRVLARCMRLGREARASIGREIAGQRIDFSRARGDLSRLARAAHGPWRNFADVLGRAARDAKVGYGKIAKAPAGGNSAS